MKITKKIIKEIEAKTNCSVSVDDSEICIYVDNACGEDFSVCVSKGKDEVEQVISYCENFDPSEHFRLWYGANNGEPHDPRELLDNCEEIGENLVALGLLLKGVLK